MPSREASLENLEKARANFRPPRPWRSCEETRVIERFVFQWLACGGANRLTCGDTNCPSGRAWARALGVSHTWVQKLVRQFQADPAEMQREVRECGHPTFGQLRRARDRSQEMRDRCELRRHAEDRVILGRDAILMNLREDPEYRQAILRAEQAEQRARNLSDERELEHEFDYDY